MRSFVSYKVQNATYYDYMFWVESQLRMGGLGEAIIVMEKGLACHNLKAFNMLE